MLGSHTVVSGCAWHEAFHGDATFKIFFVDVLLNMARSELMLTLPMAVHVDDTGLIGSSAKATSREMQALQVWTESVLGVAFKALKEKFSWSAWATQLTQLVRSEVR